MSINHLPKATPFILIGVALLSSCQCGTAGNLNPDSTGDAGGGAPDGPPACSPAGTCDGSLVCRFDRCIEPPTACSDDQQCVNDTYCESNECIPYGVGPRGPTNAQCKNLAVVGLFSPAEQCKWTGPPSGDPWPNHKNVLVTPLVADFQFNGPSGGELGSAKPSIVFTTYNCEDGSSGQEPGCYGVIRVVDGKTCSQQYSMAGVAPAVIGSVTPAIADLDLDGRPDIVTARIGGGIIGFKFSPTTNSFVEMWTQYASENSTVTHADSLSVHDLDDDGVPEIVQVGAVPVVYRNNGTVLTVSSEPTRYDPWQLHAVLADVDGDGTVELLNGKHKFQFNRATKQWNAPIPASPTTQLGQVALADFGTFGPTPGADDRTRLDGVPELAVVTVGQVRVQTIHDSPRLILGPLAIPGGGAGGAPTIGDFDGDGRVEVGVAGGSSYSVFDLDCIAGQAPTATCPTPNPTVQSTALLWSRPSQDQSSNQTGSSVFDFEGDGRAEVVYADECFSRVYDGQTGEVLFSQHHTSCTWYENPIVADVDGDFRSEIVVPSNSNCSVACPAIDPIHDGARCETDADCPGTTRCGREAAGDRLGRCRCASTPDCGGGDVVCTTPINGPSVAGNVCRSAHPTGAPQRGIKVLKDGADRWVNSRMIWNQHAYSVTGINEDGTVPRTSAWKANWKEPKLNNFRMNVQGSIDPGSASDVTSGAAGEVACGTRTFLKAKVCNRGTAPIASGIPVTFYQGTKAPSNKICVASSVTFLAQGSCEVVTCEWPIPTSTPTDVVISADDDGTGTGTANECNEGNNRGLLRFEGCGTIN